MDITSLLSSRSAHPPSIQFSDSVPLEEAFSRASTYTQTSLNGGIVEREEAIGLTVQRSLAILQGIAALKAERERCALAMGTVFRSLTEVKTAALQQRRRYEALEARIGGLAMRSRASTSLLLEAEQDGKVGWLNG